jgi:acetoin utilization protein AcuB
MLVSRLMDQHPKTLEPGMTVTQAQRLMHETKAFHLPVVDEKNQLKGLVTKQTLMIEPEALGSTNIWELARYLSGLKVREVMIRKKNVVTIDTESTFEDAAALMVSKKVRCLPVLEKDTLVGLLTGDRLLAHLTQMLALDIPAVRVMIKMPFKKGELAKLVSIVSAKGWGILTLGGAPDEKEEGMWQTVLKIRHVTKEEVAAALSKIEGQTIVDIR